MENLKSNIVHIIDRFSAVNFGIWNAAVNTASLLEKSNRFQTYLVFPKTDFQAELKNVKLIPIGELSERTCLETMKIYHFSPENTVIVTHGCWRYPTRWGYCLKKEGFAWMYVPHGMLEPWSMAEKWLKKNIYFRFFEKKFALKSDVVRAVGKPEATALREKFTDVILIPNGVECSCKDSGVETGKTVYLFMARLHHKKGIDLLLDAWKQSSLYRDKRFELRIAGPDDGLLALVESCVGENIRYLGAVYGDRKERELSNADFFILPSHSEGFPTSVLEAMSFGIVPLITVGCNFPEAFLANVAEQISPTVDGIIDGLEKTKQIAKEDYRKLSDSVFSFVKENYSVEIIAQMLESQYRKLLRM